MKFFDWEIDLVKDLKPYIDIPNKRMAVLSKDDDEIHLSLELDENNRLVIHPRFNINIVFVGDKHLKFTVNWSE